MGKKRKLFCEYGPIAYKISLFKEAKKKDLIDKKMEENLLKRKTERILNIFGKVIQKYYLENCME